MKPDLTSALATPARRGARFPSPSRVERTAYAATAAACLAIILLTIGEAVYDGDDTPFHVLDVAALLVIAIAATLTHRAFLRERANEAVAARVMAESERLQAAQIANQAKSRYLANVSHEIRSPLNAIYGYAQLVERDGGVNPREAARVIRRCAEHMTSLVEGLLDVAQIEHGVLRVRSDDVRFVSYLEQIVSMMRPAAAAKGLAFDFLCSGRLPEMVRMDSSRLRQVLINLLSNAIKFTDHGSVTFRVSYSGQIARFEVRDTGPGIAQAEIDRVFDLFERGEDEDKASRPGAGLGLTISRAIVDILGGHLEVESSPGQGSCFRVTMMLGEVLGALEQAGVQSWPSGYEGRRRSILVVDDEAEQREVLERFLGQLGFEVCAVPNGETALALAQARAFDAALLDISMPGLSGWETALGLREQGAVNLRIVMLSANVQEFHHPEFDKPVHDHFLTKPFDFAALTEILGGMLKLSWTRHEASPPPPRTAAGSAIAVSATSVPAELSAGAREHLTRLRELLRIGYLRGIEAEIRALGECGPDAAPLSSRLLGCLDRFDLAGMTRILEGELG